MKKENKIIIFAAILVLLVAIFLYYNFYFSEKEKVVLDTPEREMIFEDFLGNPVISGNFIEMDFEKNILYFDSYDRSQKKDIIYSVQVTEKTIFRKTSREIEKPETITDYRGFFSVLSQGSPLKVYVANLLEEKPEAFAVEIDTDFPFFPEPALMDSL